jgi:hypothetical protein
VALGADIRSANIAGLAQNCSAVGSIVAKVKSIMSEFFTEARPLGSLLSCCYQLHFGKPGYWRLSKVLSGIFTQFSRIVSEGSRAICNQLRSIRDRSVARELLEFSEAVG